MIESNLKKMNAVKFKHCLAILTLLAGALGTQAHAQTGILPKESKSEKTDKKADEVSAVKISDQLEIWKKQVAEDMDRLSKFIVESELPPKVSEADLENRKRTLERTQLAISRHFNAIKSIDENKLALEGAKKAAAEWSGYGDNPPKSMLVLDELNNRKETLAEKTASDRSSLDIYQRTLDGWLEESKRLDARISEAQKNQPGTEDRNHAAVWNLESDKEKQRLLFIQSSALQFSITALKTSIQTLDWESDLLRKKIREANLTAVLGKEDIEQINAASSDRRKALRAEIDALRNRQSKASADEAKALANLESAKSAEPADPLALELASINHEASQVRLDSIQQMISSLESLGQIEAYIPESYQHRLILLDPKSSPSERKDSVTALQSLQQRLATWEVVANNELKAITAAIGNEQARATSFPADDPRLSSLNRIRTSLWERQSLMQRLIQSISNQTRTLDSWLAIHLSKNKEALHEKVSGLFQRLWASTKRVWDIPINQYEDVIERDGQKIVQIRDVSLGSMIQALILFVIAYLVASNIFRRIQHMLVGRGIIGENQARTLKNWIMLLVAFLLALATLNWLSIPLTIFAFLAGALAIGVGFGTQTIIKNFISGIILLFERKIRVGDIVEVDNTVGVVSEINTRSSIIRGFNGVESLVPNALFLENRVVNWTLNNRLLLREIKISVAYGSPTQDVIEILKGVAQRHGLVLKKPEPFATLSNFGDHALDFTLYFWVEIQEGNNRLVIDSDLRVMIEKCLADAGISIPFPQRDLNLGTSKPLQIQIQSAETPQ